jgi:large conductance mechanosensitive channel
MLKEFREFAVRGNVLELAIAVILGAAFGAIVTSLVNDVIMPPIGRLLRGVDFANLFVALDGGHYPSVKAAKEAGAATINYGLFINTVLNFCIVAAVLFFVVRGLTAARRKPDPAPTAPTTKPCPHCTMTIPLGARRCPYCTSSLG